MNAMRIPHLKSCPCEECAGVYERPVLDDEEEREKGRVRCTQDGCPGGKIRNPHTRRCIRSVGTSTTRGARGEVLEMLREREREKDDCVS